MRCCWRDGAWGEISLHYCNNLWLLGKKETPKPTTVWWLGLLILTRKSVPHPKIFVITSYLNWCVSTLVFTCIFCYYGKILNRLWWELRGGQNWIGSVISSIWYPAEEYTLLEWENRENEKRRNPRGLMWLSKKSGWFLL